MCIYAHNVTLCLYEYCFLAKTNFPSFQVRVPCLRCNVSLELGQWRTLRAFLECEPGTLYTEMRIGALNVVVMMTSAFLQIAQVGPLWDGTIMTLCLSIYTACYRRLSKGSSLHAPQDGRYSRSERPRKITQSIWMMACRHKYCQLYNTMWHRWKVCFEYRSSVLILISKYFQM